MFEDVRGMPVRVGDKVGVAFSFSQASVGYIRLGEIVSLEPFHVRWVDEDKVSPKMKYQAYRVVRLD